MSLIKTWKRTGPTTDHWGIRLTTACTWTWSHWQQPSDFNNPINYSSTKRTCLQIQIPPTQRQGCSERPYERPVEVQVHNISCPSFVHQSHYSITEHHQISQSQPALGEVMLAISHHLFVYTEINICTWFSGDWNKLHPQLGCALLEQMGFLSGEIQPFRLPALETEFLSAATR